jgi:sterol desaturase/sphingolipid hydroxylase (fatty acid hydroxylase superfamily)
MQLRRVVETVFLPVMAGLAVAVVATARVGAPKALLVALILVAVAVSFAAEHVAPYERDWNSDHGDRVRDVVHAIVNEGTVLGSLLLLPWLVDRVAVGSVWPSGWPFGLQVVVAVLVADAGITLTHRASHRFGWLWRLHAVHHSVQRMYGFNGLMKHPAHQAIELTAGVVPLVLAGVDARVATALAGCVAIQLLLQHSNVDYATGGLDRWLALNRPHRYHHVAAAGEGDVNFGLFTNMWDRFVLHTAIDGQRRFASTDLGLAGRSDYPHSWPAQMVEPFRS